MKGREALGFSNSLLSQNIHQPLEKKLGSGSYFTRNQEQTNTNINRYRKYVAIVLIGRRKLAKTYGTEKLTISL